MIGGQAKDIEKFVDRDSEFNSFCNLFVESEKPVMFLWGGTGVGKSSLVQRMEYECKRKEIPRSVLVWGDMRNYDYISIMRRIRNDLGQESFYEFTDQLNYFTVNGYKRKIEVDVKGTINVATGLQVTNSSVGDIVGIKVEIIDNNSTEPRSDIAVPKQEQMIRLTEKFVKNLAEATKDNVTFIFFDSIERMTEETRNWLCCEFLSVIINGDLSNLRLILSGRDTLSFGWDFKRCIKEHELRPLAETDILEYLLRRGVDENDCDKLAGVIYLATQGNPRDIANMADLWLARSEKRSQSIG